MLHRTAGQTLMGPELSYFRILPSVVLVFFTAMKPEDAISTPLAQLSL